MRARVLVILVLGSISGGFWWAAGCSVYDSSLLAPAEGGTPGDGSADASSEASGCWHRRWPERPAMDDPSSGDIPAFYNVAVSIDFGVREDGGAAPLLGYDLDNTCTCQGQAESCHDIVEGGAGHCDFEGGVDNAGLTLVRQFSAFPGFFQQEYINQRLQNGFYTAVFRISKYNGKPNDTQVELAYFPSNGTSGIEQGFPATPKYDGNDQWTIDPESILGGSIPDGGDPAPKYVDQSAYVANGVLVANLGFPIAVGASANDNTLTIDLIGAVVTAKLIPSMGAFKTDDGVIAGRWATTKMLTSLAVLHDPFDPMNRLCGTNTTYQLIKNSICPRADVASNVLEDNKNAPCGALTVGLAFTSSIAKINGTFPRGDAGTPCGAQWIDSCMQ